MTEFHKLQALPDRLQHLLENRLQQLPPVTLTEEEKQLIGEVGYTPPDSSVIEDAVTALLLGKNVLLKGPTGSGKTRLASLLSRLFQQPMYSINCSVDLDAEALLGYKTLDYDEENKARIAFVPGPVEKAMKRGQLLYIDEINMAKADTLPILNGVLDYRRMILNPFTGETIQATTGFGVIAAINEGYIGTTPLNEALKNRFIVIDVPYLQGTALEEMLSQQSLLKDNEALSLFVRLSQDLLSKVKEGQISEEAASIRSLLDACDLSTFMPPLRAIRRAIVDKLEDEREKSAVSQIAETLF
jgi:nitric oxide reductase NorQ protein